MSVPMELDSVLHFLENKSILVTGATGFLAKILMEKILRVQPNVKKLYCLLRAKDAKSASQRFHNEIIEKDLFRVLKEKHGATLSTLISEKITLVPGDISHEDLGVKDPNLTQEMLDQLDAVINLAATTNFDERYDVSLGLNTFGGKHVLEFARKCAKLKVHVHVSTAYVSGEKSGLILETPYKMGESLNGVRGLDIEEEKELVELELSKLEAEGASEETVTLAMKDLGLKRARQHGWPNTYVFTKAMGEMLLGQYSKADNISLVILRPTIITSTYKEPFSGWAEGVRTIDSLAVGYGKGRITSFLGDPQSIIDVIPADMVVNAIIVAMAAHAKQHNDPVIYHVGSSARNPLKYENLQDYGHRYFTNKPWINKEGEPVKVGKVTVLNSMTSFNRYMAIRYIIPLKGLELANAAFCKYFQSTYSDLNRKIKFVMRLVELYGPYLFFKAIFDDTNSDKLWMAARHSGVETDIFYFDPAYIYWEDYFMNIHIPGIVKYVFK